ncbi:hypothetical protein GOP47_0024099, partial [Adiantum capillus-veneris]
EGKQGANLHGVKGALPVEKGGARVGRRASRGGGQVGGHEDGARRWRGLQSRQLRKGKLAEVESYKRWPQEGEGRICRPMLYRRRKRGGCRTARREGVTKEGREGCSRRGEEGVLEALCSGRRSQGPAN